MAPLTAKEREQWSKLPWDDARYVRELGVPKAHGALGLPRHRGQNAVQQTQALFDHLVGGRASAAP